MWYCVDTSTCLPLPSGGSRGRSCRKPCGSPPSSVLWARTTAADPSLPPPVSLGGQYSTSRVCSLPMGHPHFPRDLVLFGLGRTRTLLVRDRQLSWVHGKSS